VRPLIRVLAPQFGKTVYISEVNLPSIWTLWILTPAIIVMAEMQNFNYNVLQRVLYTILLPSNCFAASYICRMTVNLCDCTKYRSDGHHSCFKLLKYTMYITVVHVFVESGTSPLHRQH